MNGRGYACDDTGKVPKFRQWIYIGYDISYKFSKVGKTTVGLEIRHVSPQNPNFIIYKAYWIPDSYCVHQIERNLLFELDEKIGYLRIFHQSTGSKSECFDVNPREMENLVEEFLKRHYRECLFYNSIYGDYSSYQYPGNIDNLRPQVGVCNNRKITRKDYFPDNTRPDQIDLGSGYVLDLHRNREVYIDEEGNEYLD